MRVCVHVCACACGAHQPVLPCLVHQCLLKLQSCDSALILAMVHHSAQHQREGSLALLHCAVTWFRLCLNHLLLGRGCRWAAVSGRGMGGCNWRRSQDVCLLQGWVDQLCHCHPLDAAHPVIPVGDLQQTRDSYVATMQRHTRHTPTH